MKLNKMIAASAVALTVLAGVTAQDFDSDFSFGDDFDFGSDSSTSSSPVTVSADIETSIRDYVDGSVEKVNGIGDTNVTAKVDGKLGVSYSGSKVDGNVVFDFNSDTIKNHPEDVINELTITTYFDNLKVEAGKMNIVWGKGDKLHVLDNFNADDYSDFIIPDYLDRRVSTPMVRASYGFNYSGNVLSNIKVEGVYTPFLPTDRFATEGVWVPAQVSAIKSTVTNAATNYVANAFSNYTATVAMTPMDTIAASYKSAAADYQAKAIAYKAAIAALQADPTNTTLQGNFATAKTNFENSQATFNTAKTTFDTAQANLKSAGTAYMYALNNASALSNNPNMIYPNTNQFKYGQYGGRLTFTVGTLDLGLSYYNGYYKQPTFDGNKFVTYMTKYLSNQTVTEEDKFLVYDKKQTVGAEFATILWHFNVRGEGAYNMTEDWSGDNKYMHNQSVQWLGGFDIDLPFWDANLNVQETGSYILGYDNVKKGDVDYSENGPSKNRVVANLTTSFLNGKVAPEVTALYGIEYGDFVLQPKIVYSPSGEVSLIASGMYIWTKNENSEFYAWRKNSFVQVGAKLSF